MSCHHIDFIAFHLAAERHLRLAFHDPFAQPRGHLLDIITIKIQLLSNLFIREIQPHEIEAENPDPQRLVMAGEDRAGQVVEAFLTGLALVALSLRLGRIVPLFRNPRRVAMGTGYTLGPAQLADRLEALMVVDEVLDVDHRR